jgi:ADP-heptose:LPS heptosyltransferase
MPKTLIIRACGIGDFVLNVPALIALHRRNPDTTFTLVGNPSNLDLAREFIPIDKVHSIELQPWSRLFYKPLSGLQFDAAVVWMKDPTVAENLAASGIPRVIRADPFPQFGHAADHLLRTLGLPRPSFPDLWNPTSADVLVHAGSGSPKKNWPSFDELMKRLPEARTIPANLSLVELSQLLRSSRAFIGNDSGITHLAAYLGCPTVALFGPTDPRIWGPVGRRTRILWKNKLEEISVEDVLTCTIPPHATHTRTRING